MKKLSLKQVALIASICTGIVCINTLWGCIEHIKLYSSHDFDPTLWGATIGFKIIHIVRGYIVPALGWFSIFLFMIVLYSKQK